MAIRPDPVTNDDIEECWQEFWLPLLESEEVREKYPDVFQAMKVELFDYRQMMREVAIAYCDVTGGRISKPNTLAVEVIGVVNDELEDHITRAHREMIRDFEDIASDLADDDSETRGVSKLQAHGILEAISIVKESYGLKTIEEEQR